MKPPYLFSHMFGFKSQIVQFDGCTALFISNNEDSLKKLEIAFPSILALEESMERGKFGGVVNRLRILIGLLIRFPRAGALSLFYSCWIRLVRVDYICSELYQMRFFHILSLIDPSRKECLGVMLGGGHYYNEEKVLGAKWSEVFLTNFFVHGHGVADFLRERAKGIMNLVPLGMVSNAIFQNSLTSLEISEKYDICVISNCKKDFPNHFSDRKVFGVLRDLCISRKFKLCVAGRYRQGTDLCDYERLYFQKIFEGAAFSYRPLDGYSTYELSDNSEVTIGDHTTALSESFHRGNKIVAFNSSGHPSLEFFYKGPWIVNLDNFVKAVVQTHGMDEPEWRILSAKERSKISTVVL